MNQMLLPSILSRSLRHQHSPHFWVRRNGVLPYNTLATTKESVLPTNLERKPLDKGYVVSYLVDSCGLSPKKAISASNLVHFDAPDRPNAVVNFLKSKGFSQPQITELVRKFPTILVYDPQKSLLPKFEFLLRSTGISESEIPKFVLRRPGLLRRSFERKVEPAYDYVKGLIGAEKADSLLRRGSRIFNLDFQSRIVPNVNVLREIGMPQQSIATALVNCTDIFFLDHVELKRIAEEVKQMGFDPSKSTFTTAIKARSGDVWDRCNGVYSRWGWSEDDIRVAFASCPGCMLLPEKRISTVMDFVVNELEWESRLIARCPEILFCNMEEIIVPRCSVVRLLILEGLVEKDCSLASVLFDAEEEFLEKYVTRYIHKIPQLYDIYLSKKASCTRSSEEGYMGAKRNFVRSSEEEYLGAKINFVL